MTREELKKTRSFATRRERVRLMHKTMLSMNHENAYFSWIYTMPDEPSEEDFEDFARDKEDYKELVDTFLRIFDRYKKDGLFEPSKDVEEFTSGLCDDIDIYRRRS